MVRGRNITRGMNLLLLTLTALCCTEAYASSFFVRDALRDANVRPIEATAATATVRNAVSARLKDEVVRDETLAGFVLQPRLIKTNGVYILTVEKLRGPETLFSSQSRLSSLDDLERAAKIATNAAIDQQASGQMAQPVYSASLRQEPLRQESISSRNDVTAAPLIASRSGTTTSATEPQSPAPKAQSAKQDKTSSPSAVEIIPNKQAKATQWMIGFGPFLSRNLKSDRAMYDLMAGHKWNVNPQVSINTIVEAAYSNAQDQAQVYNFAVGGNYYVPGDEDTAPFVTFDLGYGMAQDKNGNKGDGISFGTGVGFEFFRTTATTLDLLLRYSMIFDDTTPQSGMPAVVGLRVGVNF